MKNSQIRNEYLVANNLAENDLGISDGEEMMETWGGFNPMPTGDSDDFRFCVRKAMYDLEMTEAMDFFANLKKYNLHTPAYKWNVEQAIINRESGKSMLSAALEYVENLTEQFFVS